MDTFTTISDIQFALGSMSRVHILLRLSEGTIRASRLAAMLGFNGPHLSNHLRVLYRAKLVRYTRDRNCRLYALTRAVQVMSTATIAILEVRADDGSSVSVQLPRSSIDSPEAASSAVPTLDWREPCL